ncbi:MAG: hypothetical protein QM451_03425, partial [Bacillota bacterium]|nr:hypothetical protein [Bacillota bacterium]
VTPTTLVRIVLGFLGFLSFLAVAFFLESTPPASPLRFRRNIPGKSNCTAPLAEKLTSWA